MQEHVMRYGSALLAAVVAILLGIVAPYTSAADFDGCKTRPCASIEAHAYDPTQLCKRSLAAADPAPGFLSVDFEKNDLAGVRVGMATGAMVGGVRQRRNNQAATQQQQAGRQQVSQQMATFNRAVAACMSGRGYTVQ
jgi:hypothetical protein